MAPLIFSIGSLPNHLNVRKQNEHEYCYTSTAKGARRGVVISAAASSAKAFEARCSSIILQQHKQTGLLSSINNYNPQWLIPIILR
jgi:hypothetical protein